MDTSGNHSALVAVRESERRSRRSASPVDAGAPPVANRSEAATADAPGVGSLVEALRRAIVAGRLAPGARLTEALLQAEFGVGGAVLTDALGVLEGRGLVVREPRRFWRVRAHDPAAIRQLYAVRGLLERQAVAGLAEAEADIEHLVRDLSAANAQMEKKRAAGDAEGYRKANQRFHAVMLRHAPNEPLRLAIELLNDMAAPLQQVRLSRNLSSSGGVEEHAAIIEMLQSGEVEAAIDAMHDHIMGDADAAVAAAA